MTDNAITDNRADIFPGANRPAAAMSSSAGSRHGCARTFARRCYVFGEECGGQFETIKNHWGTVCDVAGVSRAIYLAVLVVLH